MARPPGAREKVTAADSAYSNSLRAASRCEEHLELRSCLLGQSLRGVTCGDATSSRFLVALWVVYHGARTAGRKKLSDRLSGKRSNHPNTGGGPSIPKWIARQRVC